MSTVKFLPVRVLLLLFCSLGSGATLSADDYRFGAFPYLSAARMDTIFAPVSRELSAALQRRVNFRTSSTVFRFQQNLRSESYDFVLVQPFLYPLAVDELGYIPLLRMEEPVFAVIMVRNDSPLTGIDDLRGKTIATPPLDGPVVKLAQRHLARHGVDVATDLRFLANRTVGACLQKVLASQADACIAPNFAIGPFEKSMGVRLRQLLRTEGVPNRALVVHPRVPETDRELLRASILSWRQTGTGRQLLQSMNTAGFVAVDDAEYDVIRGFGREQQN